MLAAAFCPYFWVLIVSCVWRCGVIYTIYRNAIQPCEVSTYHSETVEVPAYSKPPLFCRKTWWDEHLGSPVEALEDEIASFTFTGVSADGEGANARDESAQTLGTQNSPFQVPVVEFLVACHVYSVKQGREFNSHSYHSTGVVTPDAAL